MYMVYFLIHYIVIYLFLKLSLLSHTTHTISFTILFIYKASVTCKSSSINNTHNSMSSASWNGSVQEPKLRIICILFRVKLAEDANGIKVAIKKYKT